MDDLLVDFLTETNESLAELDIALVTLERTPDDERTLSLIFRLVHTIKGTCGFLGLPRLEHVAHAAENVLGRVRDKQLAVTPELITPVLAAIDRIKEIVAAIAASGAEPAGEDAALITALAAVCDGRAPAVSDLALPDDAAPVADLPVAETHLANPAAQTIRVGVDVLENLMTLVSELVLTRNQLLQLARNHEDAAFATPLQRLSLITSDLQEGVMKTRMQPIGTAWNKLPRLVRDLARDLGKKIDLVMLGADTELDRQVLEMIKDPLTHMVRNSGDHGLESTAARRAAGKSETGCITLNAFHEGGHIVIEIADDGAGLPVGKIRAKALANGLATEAELAAMSENDIQRFIFRAGFSTAAAITAVSGRGVGMDVVRTNIERIGGTIDLKSTAGHGTAFTIKIPLTLAIVAALVVESAGERFAIPQISVVELVRAHAARSGRGAEEPTVETIDATPVLRLRDRLLPLVNLRDLLRLDATEENSADPTIVVAQVGAGTLGIIVDRVFDTEEIVVKPVAPVLRDITMFSGNTILGDGSVIMILDPNGIARASGVAGGAETRADGGSAKIADAAISIAHEQRTAMLLFRAGDDAPKAVPLGLIARLEDIARDRVEHSAGQPVTQYRGRLMPLIALSGEIDRDRASHPVIVFTDADPAGGPDRSMGLVVDEIVDVVDEVLNVQLAGDRIGLLGSAVLAGAATDLIDTGYWLTRAYPDWFTCPNLLTHHDNAAKRPRVLVVEDSSFFRQLLMPALTAAGYQATSANDAAAALRLRESGAVFDAIVSDIEMPDMDGLALVRRLRAEGAWSALPIIALSGHISPAAIAAGRLAGFTDYVPKFERDALLESLAQCLGAPSDLSLAA